MIRPRYALYACAGATAVAVVLLGWGPLSTWTRTAARVASDNAGSMVPTSFAIENLDTMVRDLDKTLAEQRARLVRQRVDLEYLQREAARADQQVQALVGEVQAARTLLKVPREEYRIGNRVFAHSRVVEEAASKADSLVRARAAAEARHQAAAALEAALAQAEEQIASAARTRDSYIARLQQLRAEADTVALRKELVTSIGRLPTAIDGGAFQRVEESFARIEREMQVQNRLLDEQFSTAPRADTIRFDAPADGRDIMAILNASLGLEEGAVAQTISP